MVRRTDNASYQPSRTVKRTISPKGSVRRISTAILVDQTFRWEGTGAKAKKTVIPPSAETLKGVHDIIAGITGFTEQRGDQITVETLPFESTVEAEPPMPPSAAPKPVTNKFDIRQPVVIGAFAVIVLLLAALAFALLRKRPAAAVVDMAAPAIAQDPKSKIAAQLAATNQLAETKMAQLMAENEARQAQLETEALGRIKLPENSRKTEVLAKNIRDSVTKDSGNVTNVLRTWIADLDTKRTT
jgi:flagellar M-ring protein FliF